MFSRLQRTYLAIFAENPFLLLFAVVTGTGEAAFALITMYALPVYLVQVLGVSGFALGAANATFLLAETVLKFPFGRLSDRLGRKGFVVLGPLAVCLNPTIFMAVPARLWFLVFPLRVADGVGAAALWPPLFAAVGDLVKERSRAAAMSVMNAVYVAAIGAAVVIGYLSAHLTGSDRLPFYIASGLMFVSAATAYRGFPRLTTHGGAPVRPTEAAEAEAACPREGRVESSVLALVVAISVLMSAGVISLSSFLVLYLNIDMALKPVEFGALLGGLAIAVVALGLPLGHLADRWGTSKAVMLSLVVSALAMWAIPSCRSLAALAPVAVVLVLGHILGTPAWLAVVSQLAPTARRGGVMALVATGEGIGGFLGPLVGGVLWELHHPWIFYGSALLLTSAALLALSVLPKLPSFREGELVTPVSGQVPR
ncbi:MAG: MFS transporter [Armatimonadota bacterium]